MPFASARHSWYSVVLRGIRRDAISIWKVAFRGTRTYPKLGPDSCKLGAFRMWELRGCH